MNELIAGFPENITVAKAQAKRLASALPKNMSMTHSQALEMVAKIHGQESWGHMRHLLPNRSMMPVTSQEIGPDIHNLSLLDIYYSLPEGEKKDFFWSATIKGLELSPNWRGEEADYTLNAELVNQILQQYLTERDRDILRESLINGSERIRRLLNYKAEDMSTDNFKELISMLGMSPKMCEDQTFRSLDLRRHAVLLTPDIDKTMKSLSNNGIYVSDFMKKDVKQYYEVHGIQSNKAFGTSALREIFHEFYLGKRGLPNSRETVVLSLKKCLFGSAIDVILAQARSIGIQVMIFWDIGFMPHLDEHEKKQLQSVYANTSQTIMHDPVSSSVVWSLPRW